MEQFNKLIEFRQAIYEYGLIRTRDAQFELVDALLLSPVVRSFPELSLCPAFRRQWTSAYEAIRKGQQNQDWLERYFTRLVPTIGCHVFSLDGTAWPHPQAKVTEDLQYVHSPTPAIDGGNIVIGHPYSVLAWVPEIGRSWAPPMSVRRILSQQTAVEMGVAQVKQLCAERQEGYCPLQLRLILPHPGEQANNHLPHEEPLRALTGVSAAAEKRFLSGSRYPQPPHCPPHLVFAPC